MMGAEPPCPRGPSASSGSSSRSARSPGSEIPGSTLPSPPRGRTAVGVSVDVWKRQRQSPEGTLYVEPGVSNPGRARGSEQGGGEHALHAHAPGGPEGPRAPTATPRPDRRMLGPMLRLSRRAAFCFSTAVLSACKPEPPPQETVTTVTTASAAPLATTSASSAPSGPPSNSPFSVVARAPDAFD